MSRNFNVPSGEMLTQSRAVRLIFLNDKAEFVALDNSFTDPFAADWLASIEASEAYPTDEVREDEQQTLTDKVLQDMKTARTVYKKTMYYVKSAFPNNKRIWDEFGENDYESMRENQSKYAQFFNRLHGKVAQYNAELTAAGMPGTLAPEIKDATNAFTSENQLQDEMIRTTQDATRDRNNQYNATFEFWQKVNRASKVIFEDDPIKLNEYLLPEGPQPDPDINFKGKAVDSKTGAGLKGVAVELKELGLAVETNFYGNYYFAGVPAGTYTAAYTLPGYGTQELPITILASGVVVQNVSLVVN